VEADYHLAHQDLEKDTLFFDPIYTLHSPERTLGHSAVAQANEQAALAEQMTTHEPASESYQALQASSDKLVDNVQTELRLVREAISVLGATAEATMTHYFDTTAPKHIRHMLGRSDGSTQTTVEWKEWLTANATNDELLNVLQGHNYVVEQQATSEYIALALDVHKHRFITTANKLYEAKALGLPPKDIDELDLVIGDVFDTQMKERAGYYHPDRTEVVVMQGQESSQYRRDVAVERSFNQVLTHEFVHALLCRSLEIPSSPLAARWLNEAQTEATSRYIRWVNNYPVAEDGVYRAERMLRKSMLQGTPDIVHSERLLLRAFTGTPQDGAIFADHIDAAWGVHDVIDKISRAVALEETQLTPAGKAKNYAIQAAAVIAVNEKLKTDPKKITSA